MNDTQQDILKFLTKYRRTRLNQEMGAGLMMLVSLLSGTVLAAGIIVIAGYSLDFSRIFLFFVAAAGTAFIVYRYIVFPRFLLVPASVLLARQIEQGLGKEDLRLVTAVELMDCGDSGISDSLVKAHLAQVAGILKNIQIQALLPGRRLRKPALFSSLVFFVLVLCSSFWPRAFGTGLEQLLHGLAMEQNDKSKQEPSWVGDIVLEYVYPSYTGLEDKKVEGSDGAILAMPGTGVRLSAKTDRRISKAALKLGDETIPMQISDGHNLSAQLVIMKPGSYRFELSDTDGHKLKSRRTNPIQIKPDRTPVIRLMKPKMDMVIREHDQVELVFDARDDFGLEEIRLVWRIPSKAKGTDRKTLKRLGGKKSIRSTYSWDLATLALAPGEQVQFYVEALDNDTILGPKTGRSATVTVKVFSALENHRDLMKRVQQVWEYMLGVLAAHLEFEPEAKPAIDTRADHEKLLQGLEKLVELIDDSVRALRKDQMAWRPLVLALQNMKRRLTDANNQMKWTMHSIDMDKKASKRELFSLGSLRTGRLEFLEKDILYLEDLLDMGRLEDLQGLAEQLAMDQRHLSDLMEKYRKTPDEKTRRAIQDEIARIKQRIAQLLARQREVLGSVRDEYFNPDALKKLMSDRLSMSSLDRIQQLLMEGKVDEAMAELEKLRKQIDKLQQAIEKSRQGYGKDRYKQMAKAMARMQGELSQIVQQQSKVMDRTQIIRQKVLDRLSKQNNRKQADITKNVIERLGQLQKHVQSIGSNDLEPFVSRQRDDVAAKADGLAKLLKAKALGDALDTASDLLRATSRLKQLFAFFGFADGPATQKKLADRKKLTEQADDDAKYIYRELRKLIPPASKILSESERKQVSGLLRQQKELREKVRRLKEQMKQMNGKAPLFGQPIFDGMQRSGGLMEHASEKLGRGDPRGAWPHQRDALGELEQIQQEMKKSCKKGGQGQGMPLPMGRSSGGVDNGGPGDMSKEAVAIPGEDEFQSPEKYRKELIDGMKDPVPDEYKPQVQRYYEELVK